MVLLAHAKENAPDQRALGEIERQEMDLLLAQWELWDVQLQQLNEKIEDRQSTDPTAAIVATMPGAGAYSSLALACRIGPRSTSAPSRSRAAG